MKLVELQKVLGNTIRNLSDVSKSVDEKAEIYKQAEMIAKVAKQMINNADVVLRVQKLECDHEYMKNTTIQNMVE